MTFSCEVGGCDAVAVVLIDGVMLCPAHYRQLQRELRDEGDSLVSGPSVRDLISDHPSPPRR
ncbi:MAG: hypothetical protein ACRDF8_04050 [Chloroflexota bacterium]